MRGLVAGLVLAAFPIQDAPPAVNVADSTSQWILSGSADAPDETEVNIKARRVLRRWDLNRKLFTEALSDGTSSRATVEVVKHRFEAAVKQGPPGRYGIAVASEEKTFHLEKLALGALEPMFTRGPEDAKVILDVAAKGLDFLDEMERILSGRASNSTKARDDYLARVTKETLKLDALIEKCDLLGTIGMLQGVFFHIRNAQIWEIGDSTPPPADNDPARVKKKIFTDLTISIADLRKILESVGAVLSTEVKVSSTLILERLIAQAGTHERRRDAARSAARAAAKWAEEIPVADKDLVELLTQAADKATDPAEIRTLLHQAGTAHIVQQ